MAPKRLGGFLSFEEQWLSIVSYMDGPALGWFQWMHNNNMLTSWNNFLMHCNFVLVLHILKILKENSVVSHDFRPITPTLPTPPPPLLLQIRVPPNNLFYLWWKFVVGHKCKARFMLLARTEDEIPLSDAVQRRTVESANSAKNLSKQPSVFSSQFHLLQQSRRTFQWTLLSIYLFTNIVCKLHGFPRSIISNKDPIFLSNFWKILFQLHGTKLRMSTAYHPHLMGRRKY